jgi:hypothetical protein
MPFSGGFAPTPLAPPKALINVYSRFTALLLQSSSSQAPLVRPQAVRRFDAELKLCIVGGKYALWIRQGSFSMLTDF